jgi:hypothetical protein
VPKAFLKLRREYKCRTENQHVFPASRWKSLLNVRSVVIETFNSPKSALPQFTEPLSKYATITRQIDISSVVKKTVKRITRASNQLSSSDSVDKKTLD